MANAEADSERSEQQPRLIPDAVLTAMARPEVRAARLAFLGYVHDVTGGYKIPTNYYDQVLLDALQRLPESPAAARVDKAVKLLELYCVFVESLAPFQPDAETLREAEAAPRLPWDDNRCKDGKVFYFLPSSGGYWVEGSLQFRETIAALVGKTTRREGMRSGRWWCCRALLWLVVSCVSVAVAVVYAL